MSPLRPLVNTRDAVVLYTEADATASGAAASFIAPRNMALEHLATVNIGTVTGASLQVSVSDKNGALATLEVDNLAVLDVNERSVHHQGVAKGDVVDLNVSVVGTGGDLGILAVFR